MTTYTTKIWGQIYSIRANFARASSNIEVLSDDYEWVPTPYQVSDFRHSPRKAMKHIIMMDDSHTMEEKEIEEIEESLDNISIE